MPIHAISLSIRASVAGSIEYVTILCAIGYILYSFQVYQSLPYLNNFVNSYLVVDSFEDAFTIAARLLASM